MISIFSHFSFSFSRFILVTLLFAILNNFINFNLHQLQTDTWEDLKMTESIIPNDTGNNNAFYVKSIPYKYLIKLI